MARLRSPVHPLALQVTGEMDAWKQDLQKQSQDTEKLGSPRLADTNQDKLAVAQSRLMEASPEVLTLAQQRIHRLAGGA